MTDRKLRVVGTTDVYELGRKPESLTERVRRLHQEAQMLACEEVDALRHLLSEAVQRAEAIRDGGEVFPVGVREQARQLVDTLPLAMQNMEALCERHLRDISGEPMPPVWKKD